MGENTGNISGRWKETGFASVYAYTKSSACHPVSSTSRSRKQSCISICFFRVTLTVVVGTDSTVLFAYIYFRRKSLSSAPSEPSCTHSHTNQQNDGGERSDRRQPDAVCSAALIQWCCWSVWFFEQIRGKCTHRDLCRYFPEKKRIGEGRRRLWARRGGNEWVACNLFAGVRWRRRAPRSRFFSAAYVRHKSRLSVHFFRKCRNCSTHLNKSPFSGCEIPPGSVW